MKTINIIVPVYADWKSLRLNIESLKKHYSGNKSINVYYVNDCGPEALVLERKIKNSIRGLNNFKYFKNEKNLGFVKNCNNAVFNLVKDKDADILLLNSDTKVTRNFLEEMQRILYSQEDIVAVNPRSNNATVWSVPMDGRFRYSPSKSYNTWKAIKNKIPEKYITPTAHGFCMLIRKSVIDDIGLFDEVYGRGYGEENDFTMRARESGWVCAVANHAFVFHLESKSFGNETREMLIAQNAKILTKRYPNYDNLISEYVEDINEPVPAPPKVVAIFRRIRRGWYTIRGYASRYGHVTLLKSMITRFKRVKGSGGTLHIWTHEVSYTGAPIVLFDILRQWKLKDKLPANTRYSIPADYKIEKTLLRDLHEEGYNFEIEDYITTVFKEDDVILLNSSAYPLWVYQKVFSSLLSDRLKHLFFYIHEDDDELTQTLKNFKSEISSLISQGKITIYVPSSASRANWVKFFGVADNVYVMSGHVSLGEGMFKKRELKDFKKIDFITAGTNTPIEGHLSVIYAVLDFYNHMYKNNPSDYRDFSLTVAGVKIKTKNTGDYYNNFVINAAENLSDKIRLVYEPNLESMHRLMRESNFTINYSIKESFSLVTMEGMSYGHPIIRGESSGLKEQFNGANGYAVDTKDWNGLVDIIETVLNKSKTSDKKLLEMSHSSIDLAKMSYNLPYRIIDDINESLR